MQRKFEMYILLAAFCFLLEACTSDSTPEEKFEAPTLDFPLLGTIPERPQLPDPCVLTKQQQRLQADHDQAVKREAEVIKSVKG
jgi:hypothetical protein